MLLAVFGIDDDGDGAVIGKADEHLSAEIAGADRFAEVLLKLLNELFVKRNRDFRSRRAAVGRAIAFFRAREERELADEKDLALDVLNREIHDVGFVVEDAQPNDFSTEPLDVFGGVGLFDREQDEQTFLNGGFGCAANRHFGSRDTLNHRAHF